ncbi:MAG: (d)CMP kinase [Desulfobacula sp.]|nr:(d)CMP kinase [Desulfobacula sp.]
MKKTIVTIDGPAGAGKTTISKLLSQSLGCVYVDTGSLYRGVAYEIDRQKINWENDDVLAGFIDSLDLNFENKDKELVLVSSGKDITDLIRTPQISMLASATSAKPRIRAALLDIQKNIAAKQDAVFEGRDMGTVVFPDAEYKFFLFADLAIRAQRRYNEMDECSKDIDHIKSQMATRDDNDSQRKSAPLKAASDAIKIDSTFLTIDQVVDKMVGIMSKS